ncbi:MULTISPECIES: SH3 domain-containing protein [unclassified Bradyrhizobium]|uniref:SH3 domain-containing protein n=1 Tax=unclassified Bradyrhizobium TaxID=2631580 RepID=UPI00188C55E1|nr:MULTISPECIES: SH3 domain-containing protein [unclassified Bradyrhizobium]MDN4982539.1 SH3 domain-containing protein [Bradyrhizobium sp. WYCCWR 13022]QOZ53515.1 peptide-binding protein [Bradyrhizobium sp. CCBAU 53338]
MRLRTALVAALLLAPTAALAAPGVVTVSTGLRAGPGAGFPLVDRVPEGARVNIHGCLRGNAWCDVSFSDDRGWVSSQYLEYLYRNHYVYLPDYVDEVDVPVVPFVLSSYWSSYYEGRPWYRRHAYWNSYWTSHERFATRMTIDPRAARIGRAATRDAAVALGREGIHGKGHVNGAAAISGRDAATARHDAAITKRDAAVTADRAGAGRSERIAHERAAVQVRNPRDAQARMMHEPNAARTAVRAQPMARAHEAPRMSAAPAARPAMPHMAQPNVSHGPPMNAHAQMPAPRAAAPAPAMPHPGGGGGAPHVNAAPHGGGPGGGHEKH